MPDPRTIAVQRNDAANFAHDEAYDAEAGVPQSVASAGRKPVDYAANPINPPEPPAPAKNLKR